MSFSSINFEEKFSKFTDLWSPKIIAGMNNYHFKLVRIKGDFVWHNHKETDEVFMVIEGKMKINFRNGSVELNNGEMYVVPKGLEHKPYSEKECKVLVIESAGTRNTGDIRNERTSEDDVWI